MAEPKPFWQTVPLDRMSAKQWESLCDGCGKCCLNKLEDWDTGEIHFTNVACTLFDDDTCQCKRYDNRFDTVPDCIQLTPQTVSQYQWLPATCAYRILDQGGDLPKWHHLVCGDRQQVHAHNVSARHATVSEDDIPPDAYEFHLVDWV